MKSKRDAEESGVAPVRATPRLVTKAKAALRAPTSVPQAEAEAVSEASGMEEDSIGEIDGSVADAALAQPGLDPAKFMEEARAELRAYMEESMPAYIDKGVERMIAPLGDRLQKMEQQQNKLAARCGKKSADLAEAKNDVKRVDKRIEDIGKQVDDRFDAITKAIEALSVQGVSQSSGAGVSTSRGSPPPPTSHFI